MTGDAGGEARHGVELSGCKFEQLIDLCGVDYSEYKGGTYEGPRFCVAIAKS